MVVQPSYRRTFYYLTACLALQMTGSSILYTVYARKIGTLGEGVNVFGFSATAFSLAALIAAPQMGALADRWGRRPILLICQGAHIFAPLIYLIAPTGEIFIGVRALAGAMTAGLNPAILSMIADVAPKEERGRWIGFVNGFSAIGFVIGPPLGGWIFDQWGLAAPFLTAGLASLCAFLIALFSIPETGKQVKLGVHDEQERGDQPAPRAGFLNAIQRPYGSFVMLVSITFIAVFAWRFVEPQLHFFIYEDLGWTSASFGASFCGYSILLMIAETLLGRLSDRFGRKPILMIGLIIHATQYVAFLTTTSFAWITLGMAFSGLGEGLLMPALNALYLDITPQQYHARIMGVKEAVFSLAGLAGPVLVVFATNYLQPSSIFFLSGALIVLSGLLVPLIPQKRAQER